MDGTATIKLLKPMPCETCGQLLPVGSFVGNVRAVVKPQLDRTPNRESWRLDTTLLEPPKVTCGRCCRMTPPTPAEIAVE